MDPFLAVSLFSTTSQLDAETQSKVAGFRIIRLIKWNEYNIVQQ